MIYIRVFKTHKRIKEGQDGQLRNLGREKSFGKDLGHLGQTTNIIQI